MRRNGTLSLAARRSILDAARVVRQRYVKINARLDRGPVLTLVTSPPVTAPADRGHTTTVTADGELFRAACSCGEWATSKAMGVSSAKGAATRHRNAAAASAVTLVTAA